MPALWVNWWECTAPTVKAVTANTDIFKSEAVFYRQAKFTGYVMVGKIIVLLVNGLGVGPMPDSFVFHKAHVNTLGHLANAFSNLQIPCLNDLGLSRLTMMKGQKKTPYPHSFCSRSRSSSFSNDTLSLLWELAAIFSQEQFHDFSGDFTSEFLETLQEKTQQQFLTCGCRGIDSALDAFAYDSIEQKSPLLFSGGDCDLRLAAHKDTMQEDKLFALGQKVFATIQEQKDFAKIAKIRILPFAGELGNYYRLFETESIISHSCSQPSLLSLIADAGIPVVTTANIAAAFAYQGIEETFLPLYLNQEKQVEHFALSVRTAPVDENGHCLLLQEIPDFLDDAIPDQNTKLFASLLQTLDSKLPILLHALSDDDILIVSSLGGGDTSFTRGVTREYLPLLLYSHQFHQGKSFVPRASVADIAATIAELYGLQNSFAATSFAPLLLNSTLV